MYAGMFMETGTATALFARPRHPYTLGLLQSVPRLDSGRRQKLMPIPGSPRNMLSPPSECPFAPRCRYEVEQSRQQVPPLEELEPGRQVRCFNPVPADEWQRQRVGGAA
jgi:oligopeptide/dipeptide ABC transporter ATP-binding protein